jgi:Ala-tRNA(Pro) deacylase
MNDNAFNSICSLLNHSGAAFLVLTHRSCRTSAESLAARAAAGQPDAVGAKAILCKLYFRDKDEYAVFVMPGTRRMNSQAVKACIPDLKKLRFASAAEMLELCGVLPGCMPPFGAQVFPGIKRLYVDVSIRCQAKLGFNAAGFERSIVVSAMEYVKAVSSDATFLSFVENESVDDAQAKIGGE